MKKNLFLLMGLLLLTCTIRAQNLAQIKKELETTPDPEGYVKLRLKKKYSIDTVAVFSSTSFVGLADSLASKGKTGKVYGPFKNNKILVKILAKQPNTFYHVSHIVLDTAVFKPKFADSLASSIIKRIQTGETTFESMAATYSADYNTSVSGGDLGWFVRGVMLPQLDKAITTHKKGDIFKVWTNAGLHIVTIKDNPRREDGYALMLRVFL
ncbi:MAG TPA: peptidylprolyl isomerase [Ferruginibacter sp.]|nr:peptidylprolyl isomerase [Ferruginibacter sp.]HMP21002.1 peptidylprolyl isomerase [Ferruginibacter sp.]